MAKYELEVEGKYRGYTIGFSEYSNEWNVMIDGTRAFTDSDIAKVKSWIDRQLKSQFKPIQAYTEVYRAENKKFSIVTVTSIDRENREAWIRSQDGDRTKRNPITLYPVTPENTAIVNQIENKYLIVQEHEEGINKLKETLKHL